MNKNVKSKKSFNLKLKSISKVKLDKEDVVVVHCERVTSGSEINNFVGYMNKFFPDDKVLFMAKDFRLDIVSKTNIKEE